jgi:MarR family transcriptional regulator, 2-MHQ and catechol-resistance regulon repressor
MDKQAAALKLWVVLARAYAAVSERAARDVARHGLTLAEFAVMEALYHKGQLLLGEVQKKILVSSGGVTYLVDRLEQRGLVERRLCAEDRRARYAALTADGQAFMSRIFPEHAECITEVASALTIEQQQQITELLRDLGRHAADDLVAEKTPAANERAR